jgi:hypothetical protein
MRNIIAILAFLACLQSTVYGVQDSVTTGPYKISFDLGIGKDAYNLTVAEPKKEEALNGDISTVYRMTIQNNTGVSQVLDLKLTRDETASPVFSEEELKQVTAYAVSSMQSVVPSSVEIAVRSIDGTKCGIASFDLEWLPGFLVHTYWLHYSPTSDLGYARVGIISTYPWENTLQFLKTVHVAYVRKNTTLA